MRKYISLNHDWRFIKVPKDSALREADIESAAFDDSTWEQVTLPHTYNAVDGVSGRTGICEGGEHYYRGLVCYRRRFNIEPNYTRIFIEFGGANTIAEVYINSSFVGRHEGGYSAFRFDITDFVGTGENLIAVKVNNAPTAHIAPITDQGDFTKMGGIYRDVKLICTNDLHVDLLDYGSDGVYITPKNITAEKADTDILVRLANDGSDNKSVTVTAELFDDEGERVTSIDKDIRLPAKGKAEALFAAQIAGPKLWQGRKAPYLYQTKITLTADGEIVDELWQTFGIRTYHIDKDHGFFLNGEYTDLRGVNYHQDSYENGWAMTDSARERDYGMMFDMGCTAVRMAHYQHARYEYDLCDRLGIAVWTEIGIVNRMAPDSTLTVDDGFVANAKNQLIELIRQNYNHPSVILWCISNELCQMNDEIYGLWAELSDLARAEDSTRLIAIADNQFRGRYLDMPTDVVGYNRYFGWYKDAGPAERFGGWADEQHTEKANHPICISEYGGGGAISEHKDNFDWEKDLDPFGKGHCENYQSAMHEVIWSAFADRKYLWGKFIWCMFDFASDIREEGDTKGQNDKGLCTRERIPKDAYFFYKSVWNPEGMVHITEKRFTPRPHNVPSVKVYAVADKVELFVNGEYMGLCHPDAASPTVYRYNDITLKKGEENRISVRATLPDGSVLTDEALWYGC